MIAVAVAAAVYRESSWYDSAPHTTTGQPMFLAVEAVADQREPSPPADSDENNGLPETHYQRKRKP
jgi:hypothetical protein